MHWLLAATLLAAPDPAAPVAQPPVDPKLEQEIAKELGAPIPPAQPPAPAAAAGQGAAGAGQAPAPQGQPATGGNPLARLLMLPDISAIGDFAAAYDTLDVPYWSPRSGPHGDPHKVTPLFQELELGLQSVIDPYARADIFLAFTPDGVDVEEA